MAKTVKITADNGISIIDIPWNLKNFEDAIGAECIESVKTQRMYDLFGTMIVLIVDESDHVGKRQENRAASYLYGIDRHGYAIAGDVIFGLMEGPEILPPENPESLMQFLIRKFPYLQGDVS